MITLIIFLSSFMKCLSLYACLPLLVCFDLEFCTFFSFFAFFDQRDDHSMDFHRLNGIFVPNLTQELNCYGILDWSFRLVTHQDQVKPSMCFFKGSSENLQVFLAKNLQKKSELLKKGIRLGIMSFDKSTMRIHLQSVLAKTVQL